MKKCTLCVDRIYNRRLPRRIACVLCAHLPDQCPPLRRPCDQLGGIKMVVERGGLT